MWAMTHGVHRDRGGAPAWLRLVLLMLIAALAAIAALPAAAAAAGDASDLRAVSAPDATHAWVVGQNGCILFSADGGLSWTSQDSGTLADLTDVLFLDAQHGWAVGGSFQNRDDVAILRTSDGGATWQKVRLSDESGICQPQAVVFVDEQTGWLADRGGQAGVWATTDGGRHWRNASPYPEGETYAFCADVAAVDRSQIWAVGPGTVLSSSDAGRTWVEEYDDQRIAFAGVTCADADHLYAAGGTHRLASVYAPFILATATGGETWSTRAWTQSRAPLNDVTCTDARHVWAVGDGATIRFSTDGGKNWAAAQNSGAPGSVDLHGVDFWDDLTGIAVGDDLTLLRTVDGGATWKRTRVTVGPLGADEAPRISRLQTTTPRVTRTQAITVIGSGFGEARGSSAVTFGGRRATAYLSWSDERIVCRAPTKATLGKVRVRVLTDLGLSNAKRLRIRAACPLGRPTARTPRGTIESARPLLRWSAAKRATSYELRVSIDGVTVSSRSRLKRRSWRPPERLPYGATVTWKVRAERAGRVGPWSRSASFQLQEPIGIDWPPDDPGYANIPTTCTELVLFAGNYIPTGFAVADGSRLGIMDHIILYSLMGTTYGGYGNSSFDLPSAQTWPAGARPDYGTNGRWLIAMSGWWPTGIHYDALPGQVMFSACAGVPQRASLRQELAEQGAVEDPVGGDVFRGCAAYDVPHDYRPSDEPTELALIGELRLFGETAELPANFVPADGRVLSVDENLAFFSVIGWRWGGHQGGPMSEWTFLMPTVTAPDGYVWAIAAEGMYPSPQ